MKLRMIISLVLVFCLVLSLGSASAFAARKVKPLPE